MPKIVFLGTPDFAVPILKKIIANNFKPFLVITQPDKPVGRKQVPTPSPVKQLALENNITVAQPANKKELTQLFSDLEVDVCILVAYGMIIPAAVLDVPQFGFLNIHPSQLPKYRGPSPIQAALLNGEKITAVTIMKLTETMDTGPILVQQPVVIKAADTYLTLANRLSDAGAELLIQVLSKYLSGDVKLVEQDHQQATYCQIIKREDGLVNWQQPAQKIFQQFKALMPWPGLFTYLDKQRLKMTDLAVLEGNESQGMPAGQTFLAVSGELAVACGQGAVVVKTIQFEGKKTTPSHAFVQGHQDVVGKILG